MAAFLDTSVLLKYFVEETGTEAVTKLIQSPDSLWIFELSAVEAVSAFAKKVRKKEIPEVEFRSLMGQFTQFLCSGRCEILPLDDTVKERARAILTTWALSHDLGSVDALQLAAALKVMEEVGLKDLDFHSSDRSLLSAALAYGFMVRNPETT